MFTSPELELNMAPERGSFEETIFVTKFCSEHGIQKAGEGEYY
jgi:hypothetical protein